MDEQLIPTPKEFFKSTGLYIKHKIKTDDDLDNIARIEFCTDTIDMFCVKCDESSVFHCVSTGLRELIGDKNRLSVDAIINDPSKMFLFPWTNLPSQPVKPLPRLAQLREYARTNRTVCVNFECARKSDHHIIFFLLIEDDTFCKIGQTYSHASMNPIEKKYRHELGDKYAGEYARACGLYSHGIGIGSFVYLRRIFEKLIMDTNQRNEVVPVDEFRKMRMDERIEKIKEFLPETIRTRGRSAYSILSKGIHELSEDDCKANFPVLRTFIEFILDLKQASCCLR